MKRKDEQWSRRCCYYSGRRPQRRDGYNPMGNRMLEGRKGFVSQINKEQFTIGKRKAWGIGIPAVPQRFYSQSPYPVPLARPAGDNSAQNFLFWRIWFECPARATDTSTRIRGWCRVTLGCYARVPCCFFGGLLALLFRHRRLQSRFYTSLRFTLFSVSVL